MLTCAAIAAGSLAIPASPAYDAWAWLVWGREVGRLDLSTLGGPSWKPLPVTVSTLVALAGGAAPTLWLLVARTANLLVVVGVYKLGARLAGSVAGVVSALFLLLTPDDEVRFLRTVLEGHTAAVAAALAVWAIECHLGGRRRLALFLLFLLALDRPEAWPFLAVYAAWCWRSQRMRPWYPTLLLVLVPVLWFGGDWWGSGSPWHGADAARVAASDGHRLGNAVMRVAEAVPWVAWIAAGFALVWALLRHERVVPVLAALAAAWAALVVAMSAVFGYAALSRFLLPTAAILCVLAGVGAVGGIALLWHRAAVVAVLVVGVACAGVGIRASAFPSMFDELDTRDRLVHGLDTVIDDVGGVDALTSCGAVAIASDDVPRVALAWELDRPMADVDTSLPRDGGVIFVSEGATSARRQAKVARRFGPDAVTTVARTPEWTVLGVGCAPA